MRINPFSKALFMVRTFVSLSLLFLPLLIFGQKDGYERRMDYLFDKGYEHLYSNKDSALSYFEKIDDLAVLEQDWSSVADALNGKNVMAEYQNDFQALHKNLLVLDSLFEAQKSYFQSLPENILYQNDLLYHKGQYFFLINDFDRARNEFDRILNLNNDSDDPEYTTEKLQYTSTAYSYLAKMYADEGKLNLANNYYERNIRFLKHNLPDEKRFLYDNYDLIAEVLKKKKQYKEANSYLLKNLNYILRHAEESGIPKILNIVQNHNNLAQIDSAVFYLNITKNLLNQNSPSLSSYYQVSAETQQHKGEYQKALRDYEKALLHAKEKWEDHKHWEIAHILNKIGLLHDHFGQHKKAVASYDLALEQILGSPSEVNGHKVVQILNNKSSSLNKIGDQSIAALKSVEMGIAMLDSLKPTFKSHSDKLLLIEEAFPLFESGLKAAFILFNETKDEGYLERAFQYSEKSKSVLLMEALLASKATEFAKIPHELLDKEKQLKAEITQVEKQLNIDLENHALQNRIFSLKKGHRDLISKIENDHPQYYDLKYNSEVINLSEAQQLLSNKEALINYFYGDEAIYAILITNDTNLFVRIPQTENLVDDILEFRNLISDSKSDLNEVTQFAKSLHRQLIKPIISSDRVLKKLVIIPDGPLNYIPFGVLIDESSDSYLIKKTSISYVNSATLLNQINDDHIENSKLLAFAPTFEGNSEVEVERSGLFPLPHNKSEVNNIIQSFEGKTYVDQQATLRHFKEELNDYGLLHLATHAVFDDAFPEYSYLAFTQSGDKMNNNLLFTADLYNLNTKANLITLSACETTIGPLQKGEGFLGLSRAFFYGGAQSISSTLWKINDAASSEIMGQFYKELSLANSKDEALRKAKLHFLENNAENARVHPYYWAGYIISGNTAPLKPSIVEPWMPYACFSILLLLFFGYLYFKRCRAASV